MKYASCLDTHTIMCPLPFFSLLCPQKKELFFLQDSLFVCFLSPDITNRALGNAAIVRQRSLRPPRHFPASRCGERCTPSPRSPASLTSRTYPVHKASIATCVSLQLYRSHPQSRFFFSFFLSLLYERISKGVKDYRTQSDLCMSLSSVQVASHLFPMPRRCSCYRNEVTRQQDTLSRTLPVALCHITACLLRLETWSSTAAH